MPCFAHKDFVQNRIHRNLDIRRNLAQRLSQHHLSNDAARCDGWPAERGPGTLAARGETPPAFGSRFHMVFLLGNVHISLRPSRSSAASYLSRISNRELQDLCLRRRTRQYSARRPIRVTATGLLRQERIGLIVTRYDIQRRNRRAHRTERPSLRVPRVLP
jgi:hypothetical protein